MAAKKTPLSCLETVKPVRDALDVINGKWRLSIFIAVASGKERYTDILDSIPGITPKVLAKELKELEQHQLIKRSLMEDYPGKTSYSLELYAHTLVPIIESLKIWGQNHRKKIFDKGYVETAPVDLSCVQDAEHSMMTD
ncbi:transcriptional regulator, HxlR family [Chitinophaga sp. YR627]|uniref:winged helix-turn-helix transcriptional regulator n=1 Tax=Chitinophaga sp. YR627 TaxID=1881041 RepID=UPI0008DF66EE|nr:helix-turn-helix domain-containing protein [Chitinophaga sp. YR627]SFO45631.1 transcriptional regulator, HxlR family [Chitinophaga sp. YR627]